jgi:hypothetical protein
MHQSINTPTKRKRKRNVQLRLGEIFQRIEDWRRAQKEIPPRANAIRELLERGLEAEQRKAAS